MAAGNFLYSITVFEVSFLLVQLHSQLKTHVSPLGIHINTNFIFVLILAICPQ